MHMLAYLNYSNCFIFVRIHKFHILINSYSELITTAGKAEEAFFKAGFCNWNDPGRSLQLHERSAYHREGDLKLRMIATTQPITLQLDAQARSGSKINNENLVIVIEALTYLSRQSIALRGATVVKEVHIESVFHKLAFSVTGVHCTCIIFL